MNWNTHFSCPQTSVLLAFGRGWGLMSSAPWGSRPPGPDWTIPPADSREWDFQFSITTWTTPYNYSPLTYLSPSILVSLVSLENPKLLCLHLAWRRTRQEPGCDVFPESHTFAWWKDPRKTLPPSLSVYNGENKTQHGRYLHVSFCLRGTYRWQYVFTIRL